MLDADRDFWEAIQTGTAKPTWAGFLGATVGATHLTPAGAALVPRVATDLTDWFGPDWLPTAIGPGPTSRIPWLRRFSPTLSLNGDVGAAAAFVEIVGWWAALMTQTHARGIGQVRKDLRSDVSIARLLHTLTQTRLAAMAVAAGMEVTFEPRPGDLLLSADGIGLTVEVFAMRTAVEVEHQQSISARMFSAIDDASRRHHVYFTGQLPAMDTNLDRWCVWVEQRANDARRLGITLAAQWEGAEVLVVPGSAPTGAELLGPILEADIGTRIRAHVARKSRQVADAPAAWLWVENHGAVDLLSPVASAPLRQQLDAYVSLLADAAAGTPCVRGLTFSTGGRRRWPPVTAERAESGVNRAALQPVPLDRVRTTFHLPSPAGVADGLLNRVQEPASALMWRLVEYDSTWLDVALASLGVAPAAALVTPEHP